MEKTNPLFLRPTSLQIDLSALVHNFREIQQQVGHSEVMPVVKSNAYGHGLIECSQALEKAGAKFLGVALLEEGIALRNAGLKMPILVLGGIFTDQIQYFLEYDLDLLASSVSKLEAIENIAQQKAKRARVHLEIDTGMERIGVHYYNSATLFEAALKCRHCDVIGVSSHFAKAEDPDLSLNKLQLERFLESLSYLEKRSVPRPLRHIAASGAIMQFPESHLDMVRPGVASYGVAPSLELKGRFNLKPVMKLSSKVVYFKVVRKGAGVSYSHTWQAPLDTRVVTVPIGYGDGYLRNLSNVGQVLIRAKRYPVVGRVCMDQIMVDIGPDGVAYNGDEVVLVGEQGENSISLEELGSWASGGNPREFMVSSNLRVPRKYLPA